MTIQRGTLANRQAYGFRFRQGIHIGGIIFNTAVKVPLGLAVRALLGRETGPRGYKREKFPECQWQQIMAGKRNWFQ